MNILKWLSVTDRFSKVYLDNQFAQFGINSSQYLYILKICDCPGILQESLIESIYVHPSNIVRTVSALEKKGYITRDAYDKDKRTCRLYPTEKAVEISGQLRKISDDLKKLLMEEISGEEQEVFDRVLMKAGRRIAKELNMERKKDEDDE